MNMGMDVHVDMRVDLMTQDETVADAKSPKTPKTVADLCQSGDDTCQRVCMHELMHTHACVCACVRSTYTFVICISLGHERPAHATHV